MKVYLMSSPRGKDEFGDNYLLIYREIEGLGHIHTTNFVKEVDVDKFYLSDIKSFYKKTMKDLKKADVCVFEVSKHSLAIGQLMSTAIELGKPVIALHTKKNIPFFLNAADEEDVQILEYDKLNILKVLKPAFEYASEQTDTRFNFFISRRLSSYLDWIAKNRRIPRAVYLRQLISREMRKHRDFLEGS